VLEMRLVIHGSVQAVSYRRHVLDQIENRGLYLKGLIQNLPNGTVEIIAQGDLEDLKELRHIAALGSPRAIVRDIEESLVPIHDYTYDSFEVR
jgi:acylphosphatase